MPPAGYRQLAFKRSLLSLAKMLVDLSGGLYESEVDLFRDGFRRQLMEFLRAGLITKEELYKARSHLEQEFQKFHNHPRP